MANVIRQKETYLVCWLDVDFYFFSSQSLDDDEKGERNQHTEDDHLITLH